MQLVRGVGTIMDPKKVQVKTANGVETINTKNILIATGSEVTPFPGVTVSKRNYCLKSLTCSSELHFVNVLTV